MISLETLESLAAECANLLLLLTAVAAWAGYAYPILLNSHTNTHTHTDIHTQTRLDNISNRLISQSIAERRNRSRKRKTVRMRKPN